MKALIVDDESSIRKIARLALQVGRFGVAEADGGADAVEHATREQPDVILLDVVMPDPDGPAVLAALRRDPRTAGIPVIFLTALADPAEKERLKALGASAVIEKPFDPRGLASQVRAALGVA
jgi:CheY-like chemotaxis protein